MEGLLVVTPSETLKTKLIHDSRLPVPQYKSLFHAIQLIIRNEGIGGVYRGVTAVVSRQAMNSMVRMTTYTVLKNNTPKDTLQTFLNGTIAGIITVYTTMPLDVAKTKMQAGTLRYSSLFSCIYTVARAEGVLALWKGSTLRLGRLSLSGGIVFSVYEQMMWIFDRK